MVATIKNGLVPGHSNRNGPELTSKQNYLFSIHLRPIIYVKRRGGSRRRWTGVAIVLGNSSSIASTSKLAPSARGVMSWHCFTPSSPIPVACRNPARIYQRNDENYELPTNYGRRAMRRMCAHCRLRDARPNALKSRKSFPENSSWTDYFQCLPTRVPPVLFPLR